MNLSQKSPQDELYEIVSEICKAKREREESNIGDNIADERFLLSSRQDYRVRLRSFLDRFDTVQTLLFHLTKVTQWTMMYFLTSNPKRFAMRI